MCSQFILIILAKYAQKQMMYNIAICHLFFLLFSNVIIKIQMIDRKKRLTQIQQNIKQYKSNVSLSQSKFLTNISQTNPSNNPKSNPQSQSKPKPSQPNNSKNDEAMNFINNLNKLKDSLEEKNTIMQIEYEKNLELSETQRLRLKAEMQTLTNTLTQKQNQLKEIKKECTLLRTKNMQLQQSIHNLNQDLKHYKKENVEIKLQNKNVKADNKIIMKHIDKLTIEIKQKQAVHRSHIEQRELRVMRSLYQESLPNVEERQFKRRQEILQEPVNKIMANQLTDRNGELKTIIRRLTEEIELLKREKQLLAQDNKQKHKIAQNQKILVCMVEEEKERLNSIIKKMGDKIMSLQQINQTLKETIKKNEEGQSQADQSYYRTTRTKAGQFYYKK